MLFTDACRESKRQTNMQTNSARALESGWTAQYWMKFMDRWAKNANAQNSSPRHPPHQHKSSIRKLSISRELQKQPRTPGQLFSFAKWDLLRTSKFYDEKHAHTSFSMPLEPQKIHLRKRRRLFRVLFYGLNIKQNFQKVIQTVLDKIKENIPWRNFLDDTDDSEAQNRRARNEFVT